jgi:hypothetical protein
MHASARAPEASNVTERDELIGRISCSSRLPQYLQQMRYSSRMEDALGELLDDRNIAAATASDGWGGLRTHA